MPISDFLNQLRQEASNLTTKSLSPIGFGYRGRTRLERLIFLILKEYCEVRLNYKLEGLTSIHQKCFFEFTTAYPCNSKDIEVIKEGFKISELVWQLSSNDPYVMEEALEELGGTTYVLFENLSDRIMKFTVAVGGKYEN